MASFFFYQLQIWILYLYDLSNQNFTQGTYRFQIEYFIFRNVNLSLFTFGIISVAKSIFGFKHFAIQSSPINACIKILGNLIICYLSHPSTCYKTSITDGRREKFKPLNILKSPPPSTVFSKDRYSYELDYRQQGINKTCI